MALYLAMSESESQSKFWGDEDRPARGAGGANALIIDVDGFEGPLDLLLSMARDQKVDLAKISVLALVDQYLEFIQEARRLSLELAADYLVMAAWLAFLKSRLLLPEPEEDDEPSGEDLAQHLAFRLKRLEAMRDAAHKLTDRNQLGVDVFARGMPEGIHSITTPDYQDTLFDLLNAYSRERTRTSITEFRVARRKVITIADARMMLIKMIGQVDVWASLDQYLFEFMIPDEDHRSALASSFSAGLELARDGTLEIRQDEAFAPLMLRRASPRGRERRLR